MVNLDGSPLVVFTPSGRRGRVAPGTTVLAAARGMGVDLESVCGGRGICGRCQVTPVYGDFAKHEISSLPGHLSPGTETEERYAQRKGLVDDRRLGCVAEVLGDLVLDVPPESQLHRQVVRKRVELDALVLDPVLVLRYVEAPGPALDEASGDAERLLAALTEQWELTGVTVEPGALRELQDAFRSGDWKVTVAVRDERTVVAAWPGFHERCLGVAVDVGSTTIAGHLCDLATGEVLASTGMMNPQIRFGEDLMSRVSYVMMQPEGAGALTGAVRGALGDLVDELTEEAGVTGRDILEVTIVGNPIMHHLLFGLDVRPLGEAPFPLATDRSLTVPASELELALHPGARVYALPCIAGHVGADTAAAILSEGPHRHDPVQLLVDVGTNAEIVLGNRHRLLAASSPTGPAFEGAQISSGQRAAPGAIERVRIDPDTLEPRFKVVGCDLWSDEDGFAEAGAGVTGICGSGIIEAVAELFLAGVVTSDGRIIDGAGLSSRVVSDDRTFSYVLVAGDPPILVTQNDVRAIQLAKAALYAGVRLLMDRLETDAIDQIRLAGAFGSHIDVFYAMVLGLIPDCNLDNVSSAGNAAGAGAMIALLNGQARLEIEQVVRTVEKIETAVEPRFQEHFVEAMALPHLTAPFPNLAGRVSIPEPKPAPTQVGGRRRRRETSVPNEEPT